MSRLCQKLPMSKICKVDIDSGRNSRFFLGQIHHPGRILMRRSLVAAV
jgi:hypothetical protein